VLEIMTTMGVLEAFLLMPLNMSTMQEELQMKTSTYILPKMENVNLRTLIILGPTSTEEL